MWTHLWGWGRKEWEWERQSEQDNDPCKKKIFSAEKSFSLFQESIKVRKKPYFEGVGGVEGE